jgi:hypothetical protein
MPHHIVDVHTLTHTCPGNPEPHVVETWRSLVDTIAGSPCTNPRVIYSGPATALVDCRGILPPDRQCPACTVTITIRTTTTTHLGPEPVGTEHTPNGMLSNSCPRCGLPVSAILADTGRHLLCHSPGGDR